MPDQQGPPIRFPNDGTIVIQTDKRRLKLRRPKMREFRDLRESVRDLNDTLTAVQDEHTAELRTISEEAASGLAGADAGTVEVARSLALISGAIGQLQATPGEHEARKARLTEFGRWLGDLLTTDLDEATDEEFDADEATAAAKAATDQVNERTRQAVTTYTDKLETLRLQWFGATLETLGQVELDEDEVEPWMASRELIDRMVKHWQDAPFLSGGA